MANTQIVIGDIVRFKFCDIEFIGEIVSVIEHLGKKTYIVDEAKLAAGRFIFMDCNIITKI